LYINQSENIFNKTILFPMKKYVLFTFFMLFGIMAYAQTASTFKWSETTHDFGKIEQNKPATHEFKITNTGKTALSIGGVTASCGCTVPEYTKEPIAPGKTGIVKATFNAAAAGPFNKSITVNIVGSTTAELLTIKGEVVPKAQK
jgi:hypothetical protein